MRIRSTAHKHRNLFSPVATIDGNVYFGTFIKVWKNGYLSYVCKPENRPADKD